MNKDQIEKELMDLRERANDLIKILQESITDIRIELVSGNDNAVRKLAQGILVKEEEEHSCIQYAIVLNKPLPRQLPEYFIRKMKEVASGIFNEDHQVCLIFSERNSHAYGSYVRQILNHDLFLYEKGKLLFQGYKEGATKLVTDEWHLNSDTVISVNKMEMGLLVYNGPGLKGKHVIVLGEQVEEEQALKFLLHSQGVKTILNFTFRNDYNVFWLDNVD
jgi:hypothetical protein